MAKDYQDSIGPESSGLPDWELRLIAEHPLGVIETYHVALSSLQGTISDLVRLGTNNEQRAIIEEKIHGIIVGTAVYAYNVGRFDS